MIKRTLTALALVFGSVACAGDSDDMMLKVEGVPLEVIPHVQASWKCEDCTPEEKYVLEQLQEHTRITDRNALATIMGNIKQESKFIPNICDCLLYTSPSPRDISGSRMPSSA